ncbi:zinc ribbon family protein [Winogradskyella wandonensis]|uniref:Zinc ribbon family protein n=1 Tax=Winogradskyella wandonensis TaxID=1442586 RepID=A0A4R1KPI9_9FLAO|nr:zinc-ribbon domain-containing protein [Winogradskyella wandonensis]TCK66892.1 zinc ribbon family protein [Winogradskyella wandonensis]
MIFYGTNASRLKDGRLSNVTCPNCNKQTSMTYSVFGKYAYLYWIPVFPLGKTNVLECDNCKRTYKLKELPSQIQQKFELEKHRGIPLKHFAGSAILVALFAWIFYANAKDKENEAIYIKSPQVGDVYHTSGSNSGFYSTAKVTAIEADSIFVIFNDYEVDKKSGIKDIDKSSNYKIENTEGFKLEEIQKLYADEVIFKIDRD